MAEFITKKIRGSLNNGLFHDTRGDINKLAEYCNFLTDNINLLVAELNEVKAEVRRCKDNA